MANPMDPNETKKPATANPDALPEIAEDAGTKALAGALRSSFAIIRFVMAGLVVVFFCSGLRVVGPQEKAVILRFGKPKGDGTMLEPGAHWAFPFPIDEIVKIPVGQVQTVGSSIGWYATTPALEAAGNEPPPTPWLNPNIDGYLLTGDENIIHARGQLRYRISEPGIRHAFGFVASSNAVRNAFNSALHFAAARFSVDDALTRDVAGFNETVRRRMDQLIGLHQLGIVVDQIELQVIPPRQLARQFAAVLESEVNRTKSINDARSYANKTVSKARASATAIQSNGSSERKRLVEFVSAEAKRFQDLLPAYERNPDLFMRQHRTEVLQRVLTNAQEKIQLPRTFTGEPYELRIQINRAPEAPKSFMPVTTKEEDNH